MILATLAAIPALAQSSPALTSLSPATVPAGADATITLNGANLVSGTNVLVGGQFGAIISDTFCFSGPCPITYISDTQMSVVLGASMLASAGTLSIQVADGSATSNALTLTITAGGPGNPVPSISSISPSSATAGGNAFTLTVTGSNFVSGSVVQWNGSSRSTTFVSSTELTASISANNVATAGSIAVTVVNPAPGGGTSGSVTFVINSGLPTGPQGNRLPTITWMLPPATTAGGQSATLNVYGAYFVSGSTVQWNGANRPTRYVNSNRLEVTLSTADIASPGSGTVTVVNPAPGGGASELEWAYPIISPGVTTIPAGPQPVGLAPVAATVDSGLGKIYVVQRGLFRDICLNGPDCSYWPTNVVTVVDERSGNVLSTIGIGAANNGVGQGIAVDGTRHRVYVTNADDNTVSVIDTQADTVIATTTVDNGPEGIAVDPDLGIVYVAAANVTLLDADTGSALASVPVGGGAWAVAVDRTSHLAYALVNSVPQAIVAVDGSTQSVRTRIGLSPLIYTYSGIAVDPGSRVYACDYNSGQITPIDISAATPTVLGSFSSAQYTTAVNVDPVSHMVYAVSDTGTVAAFDSNGTKRATISSLRYPTTIAIDQDSGHAYVLETASDSLSVVDTTSFTVTGTIPLGVQAMNIAFDPSSGLLYAANYASGAVSIIDATAGKAGGSWTSGSGTWSVGVDPTVRQVYAVNSGDGTVSIFSSTDGSLKTKVSAGAKHASVVAVDSATHMVYVSGGDTLVAINGCRGKVIMSYLGKVEMSY